MQALAEAHDTLFRSLRTALAGTGSGWTDHEVPSHRSASGSRPAGVLSPAPTAMQLLAEVHDTPARPLSPGPRARSNQRYWQLKALLKHDSETPRVKLKQSRWSRKRCTSMGILRNI